jgi:hypothetical protein
MSKRERCPRAPSNTRSQRPAWLLSRMRDCNSSGLHTNSEIAPVFQAASAKFRLRPILVEHDSDHDHRAGRDRQRADHRQLFDDSDNGRPLRLLFMCAKRHPATPIRNLRLAPSSGSLNVKYLFVAFLGQFDSRPRHTLLCLWSPLVLRVWSADSGVRADHCPLDKRPGRRILRSRLVRTFRGPCALSQ